MKKRLSICFIACILVPAICMVQAANPNGYYDGISGKKTQALKTALSNLVLNHTVLEYGQLWGDCFPYTDKRPDGSVWDMYSSTVRTFNSTYGMNREHAFPKSWWGGDVNAAYTDINHLYPADGEANMAKSNYPLGVVGSATFENGVTKIGNNTFPGYSTSANVFEPADEYKGDFARTYFYMVTCYQNLTWKYTYMVDQNLYPTLKTWAVNLLMKWHRQDPVSTKEINRNEAVFKIQNNRNPFIDFPVLAEYLWGDSTTRTFQLSSIQTKPVLATPTNETSLDLGVSIVGDSKSRYLYVKGTNLTSALTILVEPVENYTQFASALKTVSKEQANAGYMLQMTYKPTTPGPHTGNVLVYDGGIIGTVQAKLSGNAIPLDSLKPPLPQPATSIDTSSFTANWQPARYAESYRLEVFDNSLSLSDPVLVLDSIPDNSQEISGLDESKVYSYRISTRIGSHLSEASASTSVSLLTGLLSVAEEGGFSLYASARSILVQTPAKGLLLQIFDLAGKQVAQTQTNGLVQSFKVPQPGLYLVKCEDFVRKVLVY